MVNKLEKLTQFDVFIETANVSRNESEAGF